MKKIPGNNQKVLLLKKGEVGRREGKERERKGGSHIVRGLQLNYPELKGKHL